MRKEPLFEINPNNAITPEETNEFLITPYCTRGIMQKLNESRKACSASCDVIITVGDEQFSCHRAILMECIPVFDKMFKSGFKESREHVITLKNLDAKAFAVILESVYIGELKFPLTEDMEGAMNIITICDYLGLAAVANKCLDFFRSYLNLNTVFDICACIVKTGCSTEDLSRMVYDFILENFSAIYHSERFHSMPCPILEEVLKDDLINATEKEILSAIHKWVSYDEQNRLKFINQLTDTVRIPYLYNLSKIGDNRSNTTRTLLKRIELLKARMNGNLATKRAVGGEVNMVEMAAPVDKRAYKSIYFFCHRKLENITDVYRFNGKSLAHLPAMSEQEPCQSLYVAKLGLNFYSHFVDGNDDNHFRCFSNADQYWLPLRSFLSANYSVYDLVSLNNLQCLYLNYYALVDQLACYIPALDSWFKAPSYPNDVYKTCRIAADDDNSVIYAFGIYGKTAMSAMLDVRVGKWLKIAPFPRSTKFSGAACAENKLFVTGDFDDDEQSKTGFVYDMKFNSWSKLPPMPSAVTDHLLLSFENHLWAIGSDWINTYSLSDRHWSSDVPAVSALLSNDIYSATVD